MNKSLYLFFIFGLTSLSMAADKNHYRNGKLVIGTHYSPPWSYKDCRGAEIDIIRYAFREKGIEITCSSSSYGRLVQSFIQKKYLFSSPIVAEVIKSNKAYASNSFIKYFDVIASYKSGKNSIKDLEKKRFVAYQKAGEYLGKEFKASTLKAEYYREMPGRENQLRMLDKGRIDYVVGEYHILREASKGINSSKVLKNNFVIKKWDIRAASHDKELMKKFNEGLEIIRKKGLIKKIYKKYKIEK